MSSFTVLVAVMLLTSVVQVQGVIQLKEAIRNAFYSLFDQHPPNKTLTDPSDMGHVVSCGPPESNFSVAWSPKIIDPEGHIVIFYDYKIPYDFNKGSAYVALYFNKIQNPIFEDTFPIGCDKLRKYIPCPLKGGIHLHGKYPYSNLLILKGYDGTYKAKVQLNNQEGKVMFCAEATVTIKGKDFLFP